MTYPGTTTAAVSAAAARVRSPARRHRRTGSLHLKRLRGGDMLVFCTLLLLSFLHFEDLIVAG